MVGTELVDTERGATSGDDTGINDTGGDDTGVDDVIVAVLEVVVTEIVEVWIADEDLLTPVVIISDNSGPTEVSDVTAVFDTCLDTGTNVVNGISLDTGAGLFLAGGVASDGSKGKVLVATVCAVSDADVDTILGAVTGSDIDTDVHVVVVNNSGVFWTDPGILLLGCADTDTFWVAGSTWAPRYWS